MNTKKGERISKREAADSMTTNAGERKEIERKRERQRLREVPSESERVTQNRERNSEIVEE